LLSQLTNFANISIVQDPLTGLLLSGFPVTSKEQLTMAYDIKKDLLLFKPIATPIGLVMLGCCHCMCSKWLAPTIDYWQPPLLNELETVATIIGQRTSGAAMDAYK